MDSWINLTSAFMLGFVGGLHCIGMCGPIALALPLGNSRFTQKMVALWSYSLGRVVTYSFLGAIFGIIGSGFSMAGLQQGMSIGVGIIMLASVFFKLPALTARIGIAHRILSVIRFKLSILFNKSSIKNLFAIGILNGFLPCGLIYVAIMGALVSGSITGAMGYMIVFGMGTIPLMLLTSLAGNWISISLRNKFKKLIPVLIVIIALLFILRGLNLDIPFLSPPTQTLSPVPSDSKCH